MQELLFLCHRIPYPPNKGDKVRAFHWLQGLARRYRVHLGTFVDDPADWHWRGKLDEVCDQQCYRPLRGASARLRSLPGFVSGEALSFPYYRDDALARWVAHIMRTRPIKAIVVFSGAMAPYAVPYDHVRRIVDFVDVDSEKWRQYGGNASGPRGWVYSREGKKLLQAERALATMFDASVFVSKAEAALFCRLAPEAAARVTAITNGVDTGYFDPARPCIDPYNGHGRHTLVFTGALDYFANIDAVTWFADEVLPLIRDKRPGVEFRIVGARPSPAVLRLRRLPGVVVTGDVDDIRPYLVHAAAAVAPLRIARGLQNKVLEALAMNKPVLLTPQAAQGLEPLPEDVATIAAEPKEMAITAQHFIEQASRPLASAAGDYMLRHYCWDQRIAQLQHLVAGESLNAAGAQLSPSRREVVA